MSGGRRVPQLSNPEEISLWNKLIQMQGTVFYTSGRGNRPGVQFTYTNEEQSFLPRQKKSRLPELRLSQPIGKPKNLTVLCPDRKSLAYLVQAIFTRYSSQSAL